MGAGTTTGEFDLLGPLPTGTTVLEASAGTGKTYALAGLVTRFVAEGEATLDEMLLITFGRAASQELRERVRGQLVEAAEALAHPASVGKESAALLRHLVAADVDGRLRRVRDALADFDGATIATTHQFCQIVLRSLGVAGDTDAGVSLVEDLDDLVTEVVDDLYLRRFGSAETRPVLTRADALSLARQAVGNPHVRIVPHDAAEASPAATRVAFTRDVLAEVERRKRRLGILGYDDLLTRLADALADDDAPARVRMRRRWRVVMVDEFQDTDPVQWKVLDRAFSGHATLVLIGDPKQAIYAFRGGDIVTYLDAARTAGTKLTLGTNRRSDRPLVEALGVLLEGAALGHRDIVAHPVTAHHPTSRLVGAPHGAPFRLRVADRHLLGHRPDKTIGIDVLRDHIARDLAADIGVLLASDATFDGRPVRAGDIAVIVDSHKDARAAKAALEAASIPAVYTGDADVFSSRAADDWVTVLEAFEQPHRSGLVRAAAATLFFGHTAADLAAEGDALTDRTADRLRAWADQLRRGGIAAVFEAARTAGLADRVLAHAGGERHLTDLAHLAQLMHDEAARERLSLAGLLAWLREQRAGAGRGGERMRRLDSDAAAVQILTVWVSKGLQYPIVYLPFSFDRYVPDKQVVPLFHDEEGRRCLDVGGPSGPGHDEARRVHLDEQRADDLRLAYVALTRAQSQVIAWWAPSWNEVNSGLARLLRGRVPGDAEVSASLVRGPGDADAIAVMRAWETAGGPVVERAAPAPAVTPTTPAPPGRLAVRRFDRVVDTAWRRTSYSAIIRTAEERSGVDSEPERSVLDDESAPAVDQAPPPTTVSAAALPSPMAELPTGATFGSLVHAVLETADPDAGDRRAELLARIDEALPHWPVAVEIETLADALLAVGATPLGPLAADRTLDSIPLRDRLNELDFEIPLAGGDGGPGPSEGEPGAAEVRVGDLAAPLRAHLPAGDPMRRYADRLAQPDLAGQSLRGYLAGSIDAVLRIGEPGAERFLVVDYKTNWLGPSEEPLTSAHYAPDALDEAMLGSDYPLQALFYVVVTHRYLRWRLPGYDPGSHLGGVLYLYLRGMCGPATPTVEGRPAGVFAWRPPADLVIALSDLLDGGGAR